MTGVQTCALPIWLDSLRELDLGNNALTEPPAGLEELACLRVLSLDGNSLDSLSLVGWVAPAGLVTLDMSGNGLSRIGESIATLDSLVRLDISGNVVHTLPSLDGLVSLRVFDMADNRLGSLPASVGQLSALDTLDMRDNELTDLPLQIVSLDEIEQVRVAGNALCAPHATVEAWLVLHAEPDWVSLQNCP